MPDHGAVADTYLVQAPLRIALGGGGTDLPSHYRRHGGFVVSAAIDRRVRMRVARSPDRSFRLEHLEREQVEDPALIRHPILRAAVARHGDGRPLELSSEGDVEPGTGLGSSGAYAVCSVKAVALVAGRDLPPSELAEGACSIELDDLGRTVGKQDQYAAAHGGLNALTFEPGGAVGVRRIEPSGAVREALRERFLLFYTGQRRSAADILAGQVERTLGGDAALERNLLRTAELARAACAALEAGDLDTLGELMNEQWALKRERLAQLPMDRIEELRALALAGGALGAMLMGAGGGGYLLAYAPEPATLRSALAEVGTSELRFGLDGEGCVARAIASGAG